MQQSTGIETAMAKVIEALAVLSVIGVGFRNITIQEKDLEEHTASDPVEDT